MENNIHSLPRVTGGKLLARAVGSGLGVFKIVVMLATALSCHQAPAAEASASKTETFSDCYLLESRTNDRPLLNFAAAEAVKHLAAPKELLVKRRAEAVEISGPFNGKSQSLAITAGAQPWDLSNYLYLVADVHNAGAQLVIAAARAGDAARLSVSDSGAGLTPEECSRLFTPYYTTRQHGTGLGLAIVQSVIADHHGTIAAESGENGGARFVIELPLAVAERQV